MIRPPPISPLFPYTPLSGSAALHDRDVPPPQSGVHVELGGVMGGSGFAGGLGLELGAHGHFPDRDGTPAESNARSEEHTSELQSLAYLVCRLLLEKKKKLEL